MLAPRSEAGFPKKALSVIVVALMVGVAVGGIFAFVPGLARASPAPPGPVQSLTLSPGSVAKGLTSGLEVSASSVIFVAGAQLYVEATTSGTWAGTSSLGPCTTLSSTQACTWLHLSGGVTTIPLRTLTPDWSTIAASSYFLVSASADGSSGVYASQSISVVPAATAPTFTPSKLTAGIGDTIKVTGTAYTAGDSVSVYLYSSITEATIGWSAATLVATTTASATGTISTSFTVPDVAGATQYTSVIDTTQSIYGYYSTVAPTTFAEPITIAESISVSPLAILAEQSFTIAGTGYIAGDTVGAVGSGATYIISIASSPTVTGFTTTPATVATVGADGTFSIQVSTAGATFSGNAAGATTVTVGTATATLTFSTPAITVNPTSIIPGGSFTVSGSNFAPGSTIAAGSVEVSGVSAENTVQGVSPTGTFSFSVATNAMLVFTTGSNTVSLTASQGVKVSQTATTPITVLAGKITISPSTISPGGSITITGVDFYPFATIGTNSISVGGAIGTNGALTVSASGGFTVTVSMLSFTGTLTSSATALVSVPVLIPGTVKVDGSSTETGTAHVNLLSPQVAIDYPAGVMSLTAGGTYSVTVTSFFPGATIAADSPSLRSGSVTLGGVDLAVSAQTIPSSGTLTFVVTIPAGISLGSGVYALVVTEVAPNSLSISPSAATGYAILSTPTLNALSVYVTDGSAAPSAGPWASETVGTSFSVYLFGYPAGVTVSVTMGADVVIASALTDANGGFFGTFAVPALPGSAAGVSYSVSTASQSGLVATFPATIKVVPTLTLSGTEAYFATYCVPATGAGCYLQAGDSFTLSGTGFDAVATVTLTNVVSMVDFPALVTTDGTGSFSIVATVDAADALSTNTIDTATAKTTNSGTLTASWDELAAPTLTIVSSGSGAELTTSGGAPTATGAGLAENSVTGITYTVSSSVSTGPAGLTHGSPSGAMAIGATAATGVYTATISPSDATFPSGTAPLVVSNPSATGYLANGTGGKVVDTTPGSTFTVYALGFDTEATSTITLGTPAPSGVVFAGASLSTATHVYATAGGAIFVVSVTATAPQGSYLVFGAQTSSTYQTSIADSITVNIGAIFSSPTSVESGATFHVSGSGFQPNSVFSVYFGDGVTAGTNVGKLMSSASGAILSTALTAPLLVQGSYEIGVAPYTAASTIPVSAVFPATLNSIEVLNSVVWTPDPAAFPGELVSFVYTLASGLSPAPIGGTTEMLVVLNGADYAVVPATYSTTPTATLSGSFTMFNGLAGSSYTLAIQPVYQTAQPRISNDTQTVSWTAVPVTELFSWSVPAGAGSIVSVNGYLSDTTIGGVSSLAGDFAYTQPTAGSPGSVSLLVPSGVQTVGHSYTATVTIELASGNDVPTTVTGTMSSSTVLTLTTGSGALVLSISHSDMVEIATLSGAYVNVTLAQLNATINKIYSLDGQMYASLLSGFGNMTVALKTIKATITSIDHGVVNLNSTIGSFSATLASINATVVSIHHGLVVLTSSVGNLTVSLADLRATVTGISNGVAYLSSAVGKLTVSLADLNATVAGVASGVVTIQTSLGTVTAVLSAIGATLVSVQSDVLEVNTTLGAVQLTLNQVNANVTGVANGVMSVSTDVGNLQLSVSAIGATLSTVSGNVATILTDMGTVQASLASIDTTVTATSLTVSAMASNVNSLLGASVVIKTALGNLTGTVGLISGNVALILTDVGTLQTAVSSIQGSANSIQSNTNQVTTYLIIVIVLVLIAIVLALMAVMRVNAIARQQQGSPKAWQKPPEGGAQEPPK